MYIEGVGWVPDEILSGLGGSTGPQVGAPIFGGGNTGIAGPGGMFNQTANGPQGARPPQYILDAMGGSYDENQFYWDPQRFALVDRFTGGTLGYSHIADPSLGTDVVTNLSGYNTNGPSDPGTFHFDPGVNPFIAFPGESYNAGLVPNSGIFLSADPAEIAEYGSSARDRNWQGIGRVATVVGGGAALGATGSGPVFGGGAAAAPGAAAGTEAATTFPYVAGGPVAVSSIPGVTAGTTAGLAGAGAAAAGGAGAAGSGAAAAGGLLGSPWLAGLNIGSALLGGALADEAADAGVEASREAIAESARQFDLVRGDSMPLINLAGQSAGQLQRYLGGDRSVFQDSPGRQYLLGEGQRAIDRYNASMGRFNSGARGLELTRHAVGLADQTEGDFVNRLLASAGLGTTGITTSANAGANHAANVSQNLQAGANSRASGYAGINNALQGGISNQLLMRYLGRP